MAAIRCKDAANKIAKYGVNQNGHGSFISAPFIKAQHTYLARQRSLKRMPSSRMHSVQWRTWTISLGSCANLLAPPGFEQRSLAWTPEPSRRPSGVCTL